jgi:hypothetical protein
LTIAIVTHAIYACSSFALIGNAQAGFANFGIDQPLNVVWSKTSLQAVGIVTNFADVG